MNTEPIFVKCSRTVQNNHELIINKRQKTVKGSQDVLPFRQDNSLALTRELYLPHPKIVAREVQEAFAILQQKFSVGQPDLALEPTFIAIISDYAIAQLQYINLFLTNDHALRVLQTLAHIFGSTFYQNLVWISYIIRGGNNIIEVFNELCEQLFCRNAAHNSYCQDQKGNFLFKEEINLLFHHVSLPEIAIICHSGVGEINIQIIKTLCKFYVKAQLVENDLDKSSGEKSEEMQEAWNELRHSLKYEQNIEVRKVEQFIECLKERYLLMFNAYLSPNIPCVKLAETLQHDHENTAKVISPNINIDNIMEVTTVNDTAQTKDSVASKNASAVGASSAVETAVRERVNLPVVNHDEQQDTLTTNYTPPEICQPKINQRIFVVLQKRFKLEQPSQQLQCDFITALPNKSMQKTYMQFFIKNKYALKALKTLEHKFDAEFNDNLVSISSIIRNGARTAAMFEELCQYLFDLNKNGVYKIDHNENYIFKDESNFLLKYISFREIATICFPGAGPNNLQLMKKLGVIYAKAQSPEQDLSKRMLIEVQNIRASLGELQEGLIDVLAYKPKHKVYELIHHLTAKYDAIIQGHSDDNIAIANSNLATLHNSQGHETLVTPEIIDFKEILLPKEESILMGVAMF